MKNRTRLSATSLRNSTPSLSRIEKLLSPCGEKHTPVGVVLVYEDDETREWAREAFGRVCKASGEQQVRPTWWRVNNLNEPGVLAAAVSTAMRADAIIVAVRSSEGLPLPFYAWTSAWAPHRFQFSGVLVALIGSEVTLNSNGRLGDYLGAIAKQARMEFICEARALRPQAPALPFATAIPAANGRQGNPMRNAALAKG
jgi:hypothetical protein